MDNTTLESKELVDSTPVQFPEVVTLRPCSMLECTNGHQWAPTLALAKCGYGTPGGWNGCGTPLLALKMSTCPVCQEPIRKFKLRLDICPPVPFPQPLCIPGTAPGVAEHLEILIEPQYYKTTEADVTARLQQEQQGVTNG